MILTTAECLSEILAFELVAVLPVLEICVPSIGE